MASLAGQPDRGRIIIVNFELGGNSVHPEMSKSGRPCVVIQANDLRRGRLVTVVPLSMTPPHREQPYHHRMDHRSFRDWPMNWGRQGDERWAKCDYVTTVSLDRCVDPYRKVNFQPRNYIKVKAIQADIEAIEQCVIRALGINL